MNAPPLSPQPARARGPCLAFAAVLAAGAIFIATTTSALPPTVATHFGGAGDPNGWMSRDAYRIFMLAFATAIPLVAAAAIGWLPRRFPRLTNIPNRDYWFATGRRDAAFAYLARQGCAFGGLMALFAAGMHALILDAHAGTPPRLATLHLLALLAVFLVVLSLWALALYRRFTVRPDGRRG